MPSYTVGWGDSYLSIAKKLYGNERYAQQLVDLNGVQILKPGMSLSLPNSVPDSPMITTATLNALLAKVPEAMGTAAPAPVVSGGNIVQPAVQPGGSTSGAFNNNLPPTIPPASPITSSGKETSPILPSAGSGIAPLWKPKEFITPPTITSKELAPSKEGAPISKEAIMKDAPRPLNLTKDAADIVNSKEAAGISKEEMDWLKEEAKNGKNSTTRGKTITNVHL